MATNVGGEQSIRFWTACLNPDVAVSNGESKLKLL